MIGLSYGIVTNDTVEWGSVNVPMQEGVFQRLYQRVLDYLASGISCSCSEVCGGRSSPFHAHPSGK